VEAARVLSHTTDGASVYFDPVSPKETLEVHTTLYFRVDPSATQNPKALQTWVNQLKSQDYNSRREAARTLASVAPPSFEDTLLSFVGNREFRQFAPLAFHRLNTPRSMQALAALVKTAEVGSYEHVKSADYLAESHDPQWFPLLQDVAQKHAQIANYVNDAAELGGDRMLPSLVELSHSRDLLDTRINAVTAMGYTGSRFAVPILVELLRNPDTDIGERAQFGLRILTHRTVGENPYSSPQEHYAKWSQWWAREGGAAPIFKPAECGELTPLP
jgi:HEAT repeat protein